MKKYVLYLLVMLPSMANAYDAEVSGIYYNFDTESQTAEVTDAGHVGSYSGNVTIPQAVNYQGELYSVNSIAKGAFSYSQGLISIIIGDNVKSIGASAFAYCYNLEKATLPNDLREMGANSFLLCKKLKYIVIPKDVTVINSATFSGCESLETVVLSKNLKRIEFDAFASCTKLSDLVLPESLEFIGSSAFSICESLKSLIIPEGIQTIYGMTCFACTSMEKISIPSTIREIRQDTFNGCTALKEFYCYATNVPITANKWGEKYELFSLVDLSKATLYVPSSSIEMYKSDMPWSKFGKILPLPDDETVIDAASLNNPNGAIYYDVNGNITKTPKHGIYIVRRSDGCVGKIIIK